MKITKRNGVITVYDDEKVIQSILKANSDGITPAIAANVADVVIKNLTAENEIISTQDVRKKVIEVLEARGYSKTAEAYKAYKK